MTEHILLVEDEEDLRMTLSDRLKAEGYALEAAADGEEGLRKADEGAYDLIILDVMLPKKNGFDVCRDIRNAGIVTPIIMLTARGQLVDKVLGLKIGADDYLTKPFEVLELLARIEAHIRRGATPPKGCRSAAVWPIRIDLKGTTGFAQRQGRAAFRARIPPAALLRAESGHHALTRGTAERGLGIQRRDFHAHRGRARGQPAPETGKRPQTARNDHYRSRPGL